MTGIRELILMTLLYHGNQCYNHYMDVSDEGKGKEREVSGLCCLLSIRRAVGGC